MRERYKTIYLSPHLDDAVLSCGGRIYLETACTELAEVAVSLPILDLGHLTLSAAAAALRSTARPVWIQ